MPGPEILGGKVLSHRLAQVFVHVARTDSMEFAILVDVLEQVLAGQVLHLAHHPREAAVGQRDLAQLAALALVAQPQGLAGQLGMALAQGCSPEALVFLRVPLVPDAYGAQIEQADDARHRTLARELVPAQILLDPLAHQRQQLAERHAAVELLALARGAEFGVVAILLATLGIDAGGEDVPIGRRTEPGVAIGGRQGDGVEPPLLRRIGDQLPLGIVIGPSPARPLARNSGQVVVDIDELRHGEGNNSGTAVTVPHLAANGRVN